MESQRLLGKIGHYKLHKFLDSGGMGEVYLATDEILKRQVAIKILKPNDRTKARFLTEARAVASLNHPNIVIIYEVGYTDKNCPFIVMEYIEGTSLEELLLAGHLPLEKTLDLAIQAAEGLAAAHVQKIVHRDIKPSNLMISKDGRLKILDFGLSKLLQDIPADASTQIKHTSEGTILGTIAYLSPEQALGQNVDHRSDIFSFGIVLYKMLTGKHPFPGSNSVETTMKIVTQSAEKWPKDSAIPIELKKLVMKCLMKSPDDRYQSMKEVVEELQQLRFKLSSEQLRRSLPSPADTTEATLIPMATSQSRFKLFRQVVSTGVIVAALSVAVILSWQHSKTRQFKTQKTTQLTNSLGLDIYPTFSPDGKSIAYSSDRSGAFEIYIKQLVAGGKEFQLTNDGHQNLQPAWSPDGEKIAYHCSKQSGIWLIPSLGGPARQLTDFGSKPAWSPDGTYIAFQSDPLVDLAANASPAMPPSTIWMIPSDGGVPMQLTSAGTPLGGHGTPHWSPNGKRIVFASYDRRNSSIWAISVEDKSLIRIVDNQRYIYDPIYTPDGSAIVYCARTEQSDFAIWKVNVDRETGQPQGEPEQQSKLGMGIIRHLVLSKDGNKLLYSNLSMMSNIVSIPIDKAGKPTGRPVALTSETGRNSRPIFSPDGSKIAFEKWQAGLNPDIWIMDSNGSNPIQLTSDPNVDSVPSWYPDSNKILFRTNRNKQAEFWTISLHNRKEEKLIALGNTVDYGRLSPDGRYFAYNSSQDKTINIWLVDLQTGVRKQLTFDKEMAGFPCWSPDGKYIAVQVKRNDDTNINVISLDTQETRVLTSGKGQHWSSSWSPDGDKIAYAGLVDSFWNIYWISLSSNKVFQVTTYEKLNAYVRYPAWSPRGDRIVYEYAETWGNIWLLEELTEPSN
ncbi:MAG: protein kinase [Acidobacteriota bacterium]|nr:serine/threonine-protein kinase [Blastocatellia bacterium]MDW8412106.1 protein kinase [Acidobacteriota bacterium]